MSPTIRAHTGADRHTMLGFIHELQKAERAMHESRLPGDEVAELCYARLLDQGAEILVAEMAGEPVGFVAGWLDEDDDPLQTDEWRRHGYISDIFVAPSWRRRGIGRSLLQAMSARLQGKGARRLRICALAANQTAIDAFRRFGFAPFEITFDKPLS
jgi:ribosomal protein S18 acetylase RimI-like enzyme